MQHRAAGVANSLPAADALEEVKTDEPEVEEALSKVAAELQCGSLARYVAQHASFVTLFFEIACVFLSTSSFAAAAAAASTFMSH